MAILGQTDSPCKQVSSSNYLLGWITREESKNQTMNENQSKLKQPFTTGYTYLVLSSEMLTEKKLMTTPPKSLEGRQGSKLGQRK